MKPPSSSSSSLSSRGLPIDVIVEIAERSDPITLLRCAAACRQLRRAISGEGLRRELRLRNAAGFVPVLLRGFYYQPLHGAHGFLQEPVGFVVARTGSSSGKVCNPMTGYVLPIPLPRKDLVTSYLLLTADDGVGLGASSDDDSELHRFRLLAVQLCQPANQGRLRVKMQALTPVTGRWGPTTKIPMEEPPSSSSSPALPLDIVVEIAERSDPITLLPCAAACKHLRRVIAGEGFRRDLRLRNADGFVPGLLHGFFFQPRWPSPHYHGYNYDPLRFVAAGRHDQLSAAEDIASGGGGDTYQIPSFVSDSNRVHKNKRSRRIEPVAARGGFVVLRTGEFSGKVCNPMTGYTRPIDMPRKTAKGEGSSYLLITADDGGDGVDVGVTSDDSELHRFRLLAVRLFARTRVEVQELTPDTGTWGPVTMLPVVDADHYLHPHPVLVRPPVVIAGVAYFLGEMSGRDDQTYQLLLRMSLDRESLGRQYHHSPPSYSYFILAVDVSIRRDGETGTRAAATIMLLPTELRAPSYTGEATVTPGQLLLAPSSWPDGSGRRSSLALLVGRSTQVEIWTMKLICRGMALLRMACTKVVDLTGVPRSPCSPPVSESEVALLWSGDASGGVVLRLGGTVCLLDRRRRAVVVSALGDGEEFVEFAMCCCPYEVGLSSWVPSISA
uniref:F-box domain-containing protein n=1 Tax=Oryza barthii TaxID=65489 RepID=A0A0D3HUA3_9ORYZ